MPPHDVGDCIPPPGADALGSRFELANGAAHALCNGGAQAPRVSDIEAEHRFSGPAQSETIEAGCFKPWQDAKPERRKAGKQPTAKAAASSRSPKKLFQAAITLRGSVEPADYKRYVLPSIFLPFLSLRYDRRRAELEALVADKKSDYFEDKKAIQDPDEYRRAGASVIPEAARWENLRKAAQADDIKAKLDDVLESLET